MTDDVERLIAVQREEAATTRRLLLRLVIGVPVAAGLLALLVWGAVTARDASDRTPPSTPPATCALVSSAGDCLDGAGGGPPTPYGS